MFVSLLRHTLAVVALLILVGGAPAQEFILPYLKTPETPREFWAAVKYEVELGNQKRAATMLKGFYEKVAALNEADQRSLLLSLYDEDGLSTFLRVANIPEVRKITTKEGDKEAPVADLLIAKLNGFIEARLGDPRRIDFFIANLSKSVEERAYAISQLRQSGPRAIPHMVNVLRDDMRADMHQPIVSALLKMNRDIAPPLLAAIDSKNAYLRSTIISVFARRADERAIPAFWFLYAQKEQPEVRKQAAEALSGFLRVPVQKLGQPKTMLTREADRYYAHQAELPPGEQLAFWRWDDKEGLKSESVPRSQYETFQGIYWAKKALEVDPAYRPAQVVLLSLLLDKSYGGGGLEEPLHKTAPEVHQLLAATGSDLLEAVLDRALAEKRTAVVLGAVRALVPAGDARLILSSTSAPTPLARALSYPDRRVQLSAAEAILRIPNGARFPGSSRVVEVLRRGLHSGATAKALVGFTDPAEGQKLAASLRELGYEPLVTRTGREVVRLAAESGDIELIVVEPRLPDPGLPYLLSQLRGNADTGGIPIALVASQEQEPMVRAYAVRHPRILIVSPPPQSTDMLKTFIDPFVQRAAPLTDNERKLQVQKALDWLGRMARGEIAGYDVKPAESAIYHALTNNDLAGQAAEILAYRPGRQPQSALAEVIPNNSRPPAVRAEAARQLRRHIARFGVRLNPEQIKKLIAVAAEADDPAVREATARLAAALQTDAAVSGNRLREFQPTVKQPPAPEEK